MNQPEVILAATDLSAPARHAVDRAFRLASLAGSELHVLHALALDSLDSLRELLGANLASAKAALEADARERLEGLCTGPARKLGVVARARVVEGTPLAVVAREAEALRAGLVVLGARGESFLRHALLGSTAERLLRKSMRSPLLVVKQAPRRDYRNVLIAVDFSPASRSAVLAARRWAPRADLVLLHAFELPYEGKLGLAGVDEKVARQYVDAAIATRSSRLREFATGAGLAAADCPVRVIHGDPSQQIIAMEQEYDADLIVVGKHGTHVTAELMLGSVTRHVLAESQCDVLVVTDPRPGEIDSA